MKTPVNPNAKKVCVSYECGPFKEVDGFYLQKYTVCSKCREEVTQSLIEEMEHKARSQDEAIRLWGGGDILPEGDSDIEDLFTLFGKP